MSMQVSLNPQSKATAADSWPVPDYSMGGPYRLSDVVYTWATRLVGVQVMGAANEKLRDPSLFEIATSTVYATHPKSKGKTVQSGETIGVIIFPVYRPWPTWAIVAATAIVTALLTTAAIRLGRW